MTMLIRVEPELIKLQQHLNKMGIKSSIPETRLDFEADYVDSILLGTKDGIGNAGSLMLENSSLDYIQVLKKQEFVNCDYVMGSHVGMGLHKHSWWKLRIFLTFPEPIVLGPLDLGTITTIKKKLFSSEVESFIWNGYQRLTTLPPGLIRDSVGDALYQDQTLRQLMTKCLIKEQIIRVSRYSPKQTETFRTNSQIVIESHWKLLKDIHLGYEAIEMYERMAEIIKDKVDELRYHLRQMG